MRVRNATRYEMDFATRRWHYSHKAPSTAFGYSYFTDGGGFMGVVLFGNGANPHIGTEYGLFCGEAIELVRVALSGEQGHGHTSRIVADALRRLHRDRPLVRLVVSYADSDQGHLGTIYQATNWIYVGKVREGVRDVLVIDGRRVHNKTIYSSFPGVGLDVARDMLREAGHEVELSRTLGKQKYLMPMDKKTRRRVLPLARPYPKAGER